MRCCGHTCGELDMAADLPSAFSLTELSDAELVSLRTRIRAEVRRRRLPDTVGAVGEMLVLEHYRKTPGLPKLQLAPRGTKNVDALCRAGERFSIKTVCDGSKTGTIYPEPGDPDRQLFEHLIIVRLTEDWEVRAIYQLRWSDFTKLRSWDRRMNAWYLSMSSRALDSARRIYPVPENPGPSMS